MSKFATVAATTQTLSLAAMEEASRVGQREADIDHLFLALVITDQLAGQVLRGLGITLDAARAAIADVHGAHLHTIGVDAVSPHPGRIVFHETGGYTWSKRATQILTRSSSGKRSGDAGAVLRELLAEPSGTIDAVLRRLGTSPAQVRGSLLVAERAARPAPPRAGRSWSGSVEVFVPASTAEVWALLIEPNRMPQWEPSIGAVDPAVGERTERAGGTWWCRARTQRPDGKVMRVKPEFRRCRAELLVADEDRRIAWRFSYPDAARANSRRLEIDIEPTTGGSRLVVSLAWERQARRRTPSLSALLSLLLSPLRRLSIWLQLTQIGAGISRVFR